MLLAPELGSGDAATAEADREHVLDRCENCGVALPHAADVDLRAEWDAVTSSDGTEALAPNRVSVQAGLGGAGWAGIDRSPGRLVHTPRSLGLLAQHNGRAIGPVRSPRWGRGQAWMWQTLLNGLTFHPNFAREVRAGRLPFGRGRGRLAFIVDAIVTVLGAPLVALISVPLEFLASLFRRGGEMRASVVARTEAGNGCPPAG